MNLIWTMAYGSDAWHQAVILVTSLRTLGQFTGDILVFSDQDADMAGAKVVKRSDVCAIFNFISARSYIGKDLDVSAYDKVMLMDSDIVAIAPVQPFFERPTLAAAVEIGAPQAGQMPCPFSLPEFPLRHGEAGLNSGTIVGPACDWNRWSQLMWEKILTIKGTKDWPLRWYDQPVLNHLVRTGQIQCEPLPFDWVNFFQPGYTLTPHTKLIHVLPGEKERIMRVLFSLASGLQHPPSNCEGYNIT